MIVIAHRKFDFPPTLSTMMLSINPMTMSKASSQPIPIDPEWAKPLVSLHILVPNSWWVNCSGKKLNKGVIAAVDFTKP